MLQIESDYEYINGELLGNILSFEAHLKNGIYSESDKKLIAQELENTAKMFAREQGLNKLANETVAETTSDGVMLKNDAWDSYQRFYAGHVEYGHWDKSHTKFIPARPFMRPALYTVAQASMGNIKGAMSSYLNAMWSLTPLQFGGVHGKNKSYTRAFYSGERFGKGQYTTEGLKQNSNFNSIGSSSFRERYSIVRGGNTNNGYTRVSNHWTGGF